jgi:hypothetical protein
MRDYRSFNLAGVEVRESKIPRAELGAQRERPSAAMSGSDRRLLLSATALVGRPASLATGPIVALVLRAFLERLVLG